MPKGAAFMSERPEDRFNNPDALSMVLSRLQLKAEIYSDGEYFGAWATDTSGSRRIPFHLIGRGKAWLHMPDREHQMLSSGNLVILPHDNHHVIANSETIPPVELIDAELTEPAGPSTHMICGFFEFQNKAAWPLLNSLPEVIVLDLSERSSGSQLRTLIELLIGELKQAQPGYYSVVNQLAYLMFVQVFRSQIATGKLQAGLLAALFDEKISKALAKIHCQPEKNWNLESLAREAAMGRSSFSQRFNQLVGTPVMQYLTAWRMREARLLLQTTSLSAMDIAERCGYESEPAFRKAYKKVIGETPGTSRKKRIF